MSKKELSLKERRALEAHLEICPDCAAFRDFRESLRAVREKEPAPKLESRRVEEVRLRCHAELRRQTVRQRTGVPRPIWGAFGILTVITLGFFVPQIKEFFAAGEFTPEVGLLLVIILQNTVMLFFAPVIMRRRQIGR
ncbi:MAG: zf-HC2 domain-containing protein, partial [Candidatus Aminicenantes bacterium]|nr:zf-HC2 domain-containing protein [Candidatus Aminicenantes bacterium]